MFWRQAEQGRPHPNLELEGHDGSCPHRGGGGSPMVDIGRREFITLLGGAAAAWPLAARAQQPGKVHRVGILWASTPSANAPRMEAFRQGLRELGYVEGRNVVIAARGAPLSGRSQHSFHLLTIARDTGSRVPAARPRDRRRVVLPEGRRRAARGARRSAARPDRDRRSRASSRSPATSFAERSRSASARRRSRPRPRASTASSATPRSSSAAIRRRSRPSTG